MSYKFVKNEAYQSFTNICKPNLAFLQVFFKKMGSKWLWKNSEPGHGAISFVKSLNNLVRYIF
jgi:hypothetical protein